MGVENSDLPSPKAEEIVGHRAAHEDLVTPGLGAGRQGGTSQALATEKRGKEGREAGCGGDHLLWGDCCRSALHGVGGQASVALWAGRPGPPKAHRMPCYAC